MLIVSDISHFQMDLWYKLKSSPQAVCEQASACMIDLCQLTSIIIVSATLAIQQVENHVPGAVYLKLSHWNFLCLHKNQDTF